MNSPHPVIAPVHNSELAEIAFCHQKAFPHSFSTRLGDKYLWRNYSWYQENPNCELFCLKKENQIIGFCGLIHYKQNRIQGSSSSLAQFTFNAAIRAILSNPFRVFHKEILRKLPFVAKNLGIAMLKPFRNQPKPKPILKPYTGLVVIAVLPSHQGQGLASKLLHEFESRVAKQKNSIGRLSVKKHNTPAIKAYQKVNWQIVGELGDLFIMEKFINN